MINNQKQYNRGYTLLFAVLVSSLVLSVGISILNISKKEFLLSSSARESTIAFYAADSGIECAVYYDFYRNSFSEENWNKVITCNNQDIYINKDDNKYSFEVKLGDSSCARITVTKDVGGTDFDSRGYNLGWDHSVINTNSRCTLPSPKRVERAIGYSYRYSIGP